MHPRTRFLAQKSGWRGMLLKEFVIVWNLREGNQPSITESLNIHEINQFLIKLKIFDQNGGSVGPIFKITIGVLLFQSV